MRITTPQSIYQAGSQAAMASTLAFYHAERTGVGQFIDVSIQESMVLTLLSVAERWDMMKANTTGTGSFSTFGRKPPTPPLKVPTVFPVRDGYMAMLFLGSAQGGMVASSRKIVELANADGYALELKDYPWKEMNLATVSQEEIDRINKPAADWLLTKTKAELYALAVKYELLMAPVHNAKDAAECPQLEARGFWSKVEHPELGDTIAYPAGPVMLSEASWVIRKRAPLAGEHNLEILAGELGIDAEYVQKLRNDGVI